MKKIFTKIAGVALGLAMAIGVGVAVSRNQNNVLMVKADNSASLVFEDLDEYSNGVTLTSAFDPDEIAFGTYFTLTFGKGDASTHPTFYTDDKGVRAYSPKNGNGNWFQVDTSTTNLYITKMTMGGSSKKGSPIWSFDKGTKTNNYTTIAQSAKAQSVKGTLTGNNSSASNAPQWKLTSVTIEYVILTPTVTGVTLDPTDDVDLKVGETQTYTVGISGSNLTGNETVAISYEAVYGSNDDISIDETTGLKDGDEFTVTAVNAGAAGEITATYGSGVSAVASDPVAIYTSALKKLKSLAITNSGTARTTYVAGETFDPSGLTVTATFEDNSEEVVTSKVTWSPTIIASNTEEVIASYTEVVEKTASFAISIEADYIKNVVFDVSGAKNKYALGDTFVASESGVTAVTKYVVASDGSLTAGQLSYSGYDLSVEGEQTVTVSYPNPKSATPFSTTYTIEVAKVVVSSVLDEITISTTGVTSTSYTDYSNKTASSSAIYEGNCAKANSTYGQGLQFRSSSNTGIVTTTSGGTAISVALNIHTSTNGVDVYGSNTAYSGIGDLFDANKAGTLIEGEITSSKTLTTSYKYIGVRSHSGASYINSIKILWTGSAANDDDVEEINEFIDTYMHLDYTKSEGYCKDTSNHWYSTAKDEFAKLSTNAKLILATSNTNFKTVTLDENHKDKDDPDEITYKYSDVKERFVTWASFSKETISFNADNGNITVQNIKNITQNVESDSTDITLIIVGISLVSVVAVGGCFILRKRKEQ